MCMWGLRYKVGKCCRGTEWGGALGRPGRSQGRTRGRSVRSSGAEPKITATDHLGAMAFQSVLVNSRQ